MGDFTAELAAIEKMVAIPAILDAACQTTRMGFAAIARVTADRWMACVVHDKIAFGLRAGDELAIETTICREVRQTGDIVAIDHVAADSTYAGHPTPAQYGFQSYVSVPIRLHDGRVFGTLFAIDPYPARVNNPQTIGLFKLFADLIAFHLDAHYRVAASAAVLADERRTSALREQFIAVLGHDLRNPVAAIDAGASLLMRAGLDDESRSIIGHMRQSVDRILGLIDDVTDFARGQLGGGLSMDRAPTNLVPVLTHIVSELSARWPNRDVQTNFSLSSPVNCDRGRISQLLSNILANALTHGAADTPVHVCAWEAGGVFELSVRNQGPPIPPEALDRLFRPFERGAANPDKHGLGLGLYIAREVARAHGGDLTAASSVKETVFAFTMPTSSATGRLSVTQPL